MTEIIVDPKAERAKRAHDHLSLLHTIHGSDCGGRWVAIALSDGSCDMRLYETKREAIRFQLHETQCAYFHFSGVPLINELRYYLDANETLYDAGLSLADPDTYLNPETML
jgi:hypothetical protein